jgi:hypothetical protein
MCDPVTLTITSVALIGAGTAMQMQGAKRAEKAMNNTHLAELSRQKGYRDESFGLFDKSLQYNQGDSQQEREAKNSQDLNTKFQDAADSVFAGASPFGNDPMQSVQDAPRAIGEVYKKSMNEARGSVQNMLTARAALGGFTKMLGDTSLQNQQITNSQTPLGGYMRGSASILPMELQVASKAGDKHKAIGSLLSALGTVAGMGATGMGAAGGGAAPIGDGSMAAMNGAGGGAGYVHPVM